MYSSFQVKLPDSRPVPASQGRGGPAFGEPVPPEMMARSHTRGEGLLPSNDRLTFEPKREGRQVPVVRVFSLDTNDETVQRMNLQQALKTGRFDKYESTQNRCVEILNKYNEAVPEGEHITESNRRKSIYAIDNYFRKLRNSRNQTSANLLQHNASSAMPQETIQGAVSRKHELPSEDAAPPPAKRLPNRTGLPHQPKPVPFAPNPMLYHANKMRSVDSISQVQEQQSPTIWDQGRLYPFTQEPKKGDWGHCYAPNGKWESRVLVPDRLMPEHFITNILLQGEFKHAGTDENGWFYEVERSLEGTFRMRSDNNLM